jgi:putative molybdopterin biosynthesis protein
MYLCNLYDLLSCDTRTAKNMVQVVVYIMDENISYTTEEIAAILKVSKLTVYSLFKKGKLPYYKAGREMRVDATDLEAYKARQKGMQPSSSRFTTHASYPSAQLDTNGHNEKSIIITGHDSCLDILAKHIEKATSTYRPLRSNVGSMEGLISMYMGKADLVSTHLLEGDTGEYNVPYIRKILISHPCLVVNLVSRSAGIYVQKGNPKKITTWADLNRPGIRIVNREKGSGARVLLDEQLRMVGIRADTIIGYENEESNHLGVAGQLAMNMADAGVGIEKAASMVGVDYIPLVTERYDLVMLKKPSNAEWIQLVCHVLRSEAFHNELSSIRGYDLSETGNILFES